MVKAYKYCMENKYAFAMHISIEELEEKIPICSQDLVECPYKGQDVKDTDHFICQGVLREERKQKGQPVDLTDKLQ